MSAICPEEIKLMYEYGSFLKSIVNNEYDAISVFQQACFTYQTKVYKRQSEMKSDQTLFG